MAIVAAAAAGVNQEGSSGDDGSDSGAGGRSRGPGRERRSCGCQNLNAVAWNFR